MNKLKKAMLFAFVLSFISLSCNNSKQHTTKTAVNKSASTINKNENQVVEGKVIELTPAKFKENSKNQQILDVRTPFEFSQGYIKGAKNINFLDKNFLEKVNSFDKSKPIYVYCKSGYRSGIAAKQMAESGFKEVYELKNGIINWVRNNNEIEK